MWILRSELGDSLNYGVDSVEPESNKCPPDTCIELFESPTHRKIKAREANASLAFMVRVGRFELPAS